MASPVLHEGRACGQLVWKTGTRGKFWHQLLFWRALVDLPGLWGCQGGGISILSNAASFGKPCVGLLLFSCRVSVCVRLCKVEPVSLLDHELCGSGAVPALWRVPSMTQRLAHRYLPSMGTSRPLRPC